MRTKHLIKAFTKEGLTRPQAIKLIINGRKFGLKNKQMFKTVQISVAFSKMGKGVVKLTKSFTQATNAIAGIMETVSDFAKEMLRLEANEIDKQMIN